MDEKLDISNTIEYRAIYTLCGGDENYKKFMEMLKKIVNKVIHEGDDDYSSSSDEKTYSGKS